MLEESHEVKSHEVKSVDYGTSTTTDPRRGWYFDAEGNLRRNVIEDIGGGVMIQRVSTVGLPDEKVMSQELRWEFAEGLWADLC